MQVGFDESLNNYAEYDTATKPTAENQRMSGVVHLFVESQCMSPCPDDQELELPQYLIFTEVFLEVQPRFDLV